MKQFLVIYYAQGKGINKLTININVSKEELVRMSSTDYSFPPTIEGYIKYLFEPYCNNFKGVYRGVPFLKESMVHIFDFSKTDTIDEHIVKRIVNEVL